MDAGGDTAEGGRPLRGPAERERDATAIEQDAVIGERVVGSATAAGREGKPSARGERILRRRVAVRAVEVAVGMNDPGIASFEHDVHGQDVADRWARRNAVVVGTRRSIPPPERRDRRSVDTKPEPGGRVAAREDGLRDRRIDPALLRTRIPCRRNAMDHLVAEDERDRESRAVVGEGIPCPGSTLKTSFASEGAWERDVMSVSERSQHGVNAWHETRRVFRASTRLPRGWLVSVDPVAVSG